MVAEKSRVFIAEDDFLVCEEITRTLRHLGYSIVGEASDGEEAIRMVCELKPEVVLMDIKMPVLDGLEATRQIQDKCPTPVVVITAHESQDLVEKASKVGVGAYITKPPNSLEIERSITIAMARHEDLMTIKQLYQKVESQKNDLEKALAEIKTLEGIIPICGKCKKIRNGDGNWQQIETYIHERTDADFSHGLCPKCAEELYGDFMSENGFKKNK
jgi:AmiR/NasT family two-component response regulator